MIIRSAGSIPRVQLPLVEQMASPGFRHCPIRRALALLVDSESESGAASSWKATQSTGRPASSAAAAATGRPARAARAVIFMMEGGVFTNL